MLERVWLAAPTPTPTSGTQTSCTHKPVTINIIDAMSAPGLSGVQQLINIAAVFVLGLCAVGALAGLAWIPLGRTIGVHHAGQQGRIMVVSALGVAFAVGLIAVLINLAYSWGSGVSC